jgi:hypothetical protein
MNEADVATVSMIFQRYAELGSVALLKAELDRLEISLTIIRARLHASGQESSSTQACSSV